MNKLKEIINKPLNLADQMVLIGIFLAFLYWALESFINVFSPEEVNFYRELFGPNVSEMWMRYHWAISASTIFRIAFKSPIFTRRTPKIEKSTMNCSQNF